MLFAPSDNGHFRALSNTGEQLAPTAGFTSSATITILNAHLNSFAEGLSLHPPFLLIVAKRFSATSWFNLEVNRNLSPNSDRRCCHDSLTHDIASCHHLMKSTFLYFGTFRLSKTRMHFSMNSMCADLSDNGLFSFFGS